MTGMIWRLVVRPPVAPANAAWKASSCSRAGEDEMGRDVGACSSSRRCTAQAGRWSEGMGATGGNCTARHSMAQHVGVGLEGVGEFKACNIVPSMGVARHAPGRRSGSRWTPGTRATAGAQLVETEPTSVDVMAKDCGWDECRRGGSRPAGPSAAHNGSPTPTLPLPAPSAPRPRTWTPSEQGGAVREP